MSKRGADSPRMTLPVACLAQAAGGAAQLPEGARRHAWRKEAADMHLMRRVSPWLVALLLYLLVSPDGSVYGPFDGYAGCWTYRGDRGLSGPCLSAWP